MNNELNKLLVEKVINHIPENYTPVDYLMDILSLSRDSVYRRLSLKKSFTIDEIFKLSSSLRFSLDGIIEIINNTYLSPANLNKINIDDIINHRLNDWKNLINKHNNAKDSEIIMITSHLSLLFMAKYKSMFKFLYFRILHQLHKIPVNYTYSKIIVPMESISGLYDLTDLIQPMNNIDIIINPNLYLNTIKDIQYFYYRRLISDKDLKDLIKELKAMVNTESHIWLKKKNNSLRYNIYLSLLSVQNDSVYSRYDGKEELFYDSYFINPIHTTNPQICALHKEWVDSQKRYSILMTGTNEDIGINFILKQYEYIDKISDFGYFNNLYIRI